MTMVYIFQHIFSSRSSRSELADEVGSPKQNLYRTSAASLFQGCTGFDYFKSGQSWIWQDLEIQIRMEPKPDLGTTSFFGSQNTPDETNSVNNAVS